MPIPDYQTLMLPVLALAAKSETRVPAIEQTIADKFDLTDGERMELLPSGRQRIISNRIRWARTYLTKAGLLKSPKRGWFVATPEGLALLAEAPPKIDLEVLKRYDAFNSWRAGDEDVEAEPAVEQGGQSPSASGTPEEQIDRAYSTLRAALRDDLIEQILQSSPTFFEQLIVDLMVRMGYGGSHKDAAKRLGQSGDGGVDGVINEDQLGLDRIFLQAKRYDPSRTIGRPDVQGFLGSLVGRGASKGVFVTTSTFTTQAIQFVEHLPQRVILIDGKMLADLMIENNVGVRPRRTIEIKQIDENAFSEDEA